MASFHRQMPLAELIKLLMEESLSGSVKEALARNSALISNFGANSSGYFAFKRSRWAKMRFSTDRYDNSMSSRSRNRPVESPEIFFVPGLSKFKAYVAGIHQFVGIYDDK
jgi:hypothetical protein